MYINIIDTPEAIIVSGADDGCLTQQFTKIT